MNLKTLKQRYSAALQEYLEEQEEFRIVSPFKYSLTVLTSPVALVSRSISSFYINTKNYFLNRFVYKTHVLIASPEHLPLGAWHDLSDRLTYCIIDSFIIFIESEYVTPGMSIDDYCNMLAENVASYSKDTSSFNYKIAQSTYEVSLELKDLYFWAKELDYDNIDDAELIEKLCEIIKLKDFLW